MFMTECKCVRPGATSTQHAGARLRVTWPGTGTQSRGAQRTRSNNSPEVVPKVEYAAKFLSLDKLEKRKNKMCFIHVFSKIRNQTHKCPQSMHFIFSNTCTYLLSCRMAIFIFQFFQYPKTSRRWNVIIRESGTELYSRNHGSQLDFSGMWQQVSQLLTLCPNLLLDEHCETRHCNARRPDRTRPSN